MEVPCDVVARGTLDVDLSLTASEALCATLVRVHRNWLVNADHVREFKVRRTTPPGPSAMIARY